MEVRALLGTPFFCLFSGCLKSVVLRLLRFEISAFQYFGFQPFSISAFQYLLFPVSWLPVAEVFQEFESDFARFFGVKLGCHQVVL